MAEALKAREQNQCRILSGRGIWSISNAKTAQSFSQVPRPYQPIIDFIEFAILNGKDDDKHDAITTTPTIKLPGIATLL